MEKIQGSMEMLNSLSITERTAGLDKASKELMKCKEVLAVILKGVVKEYENYTTQEIIQFIEGDSISNDVEVSAGRNISQIIGDDKEYIALGEKTTFFDTKFQTVNPTLSAEKLLIYMHIDVEMQRDYRPGYPLEKRGEYYLARELSSQLSVVTQETDYGCLEKCYSIWICRDNIPQNEQFTISFYEFSNTKNYGNSMPQKENYDLLNLVIIRLGDKVYNGDKKDKGYDVLRFLNAVMNPGSGERLNIVKDYVDFSQNEELWKEIDNMQGLGMSILEEGIEIGISRGRTEEKDRINLLNKKLREDGRIQDLFRSLDEPAFQEQLLKEYNI